MIVWLSDLNRWGDSEERAYIVEWDEWRSETVRRQAMQDSEWEFDPYFDVKYHKEVFHDLELAKAMALFRSGQKLGPFYHSVIYHGYVDVVSPEDKIARFEAEEEVIFEYNDGREI